jgi:hypothetical protein
MVIITAPTLIAFTLYRWLVKKGLKYIGMFLLIATPSWTAYEVYTAIYPTDSFYVSEFERITLREPPPSAVIVRKDASYPTLQGDYCSAALITMSENDYLNLLRNMSEDKQIVRQEAYNIMNDREFDHVLGNFTAENVTHAFRRTIPDGENYYYMIYFFNDNKTVFTCACET